MKRKKRKATVLAWAEYKSEAPRSLLMESSSYLTTYHQYLKQLCPQINQAALARVDHSLHQTSWDEPESALDYNNSAVIALIEAENSDDRTTQEMYLEMAIAALNEGADHPLCVAHLALVQSLIGEEGAIQNTFSNLISFVLPAYNATSDITSGLVYLPQKWRGHLDTEYSQLSAILTSENGYQQSLLLLAEVLCQTQLVFYNSTGLRFLQLATQLFPQSPALNLSLGISSISNHQWEGLLYLQRANQQAPNNSVILQALYLAYKDLGQVDIAESWQSVARASQRESDTSRAWVSLPPDASMTYVPFDSALLAVKSSYRSIVTSVLLAQGNWFEREMEFWQDQIQPGMTVLDVGANVGVYTFSAANGVGASGRVVAIEPFSECVQCLEETCRVNQINWVTVKRGAASDRDGTAQLALHGASELNQLVMNADAEAGMVEEVECFKLDTLIETEKLQRVDFVKIDAEGHELQVLAGSDRLLKTFAPTILYENVAGSQGSNLPVAEFLLNNNYQLFRYQPFVKQLIPVQSTNDLQGSLNIIAISNTKLNA